MRGIVNGLLLSIPFWAALTVAWNMYPPTTFHACIVYGMVGAFIVLTVYAFSPAGERRDPPCPDKFFNALPPLEGDAQDRYDKGH